MRVVVLVEDFEAIVDRPNGIDDIVADLARNQCCKFEICRVHALVHGKPQKIDLTTQVAAALAQWRHASLQGPLANSDTALIHAPQAFCKELLATHPPDWDFTL